MPIAVDPGFERSSVDTAPSAPLCPSKRVLMNQSSGVDAAEIVVIQAFSVCFHAFVV